MIVSMIVAMGQNRVIGKNNAMMWDVPSEYQHYRNIVSGHTLILGRKNFESDPRRMVGRNAIIVTSQKKYQSYHHPVAHSIEAALSLASSQGQQETFIIGGAQIYKLGLPYTQRLYLSVLDFDKQGDAYFPPHESYQWKEIKKHHQPKGQQTPISWTFTLLEKTPQTWL